MTGAPIEDAADSPLPTEVGSCSVNQLSFPFNRMQTCVYSMLKQVRNKILSWFVHGIHNQLHMTLEFERLPLVEAAVRFSYTTPFEMSYELFLSLSSSLGETFTGPFELPNFETPPGIAELSMPIPPKLSGAMFREVETGIRVLVEPQLALVRWLHSPTPPVRPYPRYTHLRTIADRMLQALANSSAAWLKPTVVNMVYVNFLTEDVSLMPTEFLKDNAFPPEFRGKEQYNTFEIGYRDTDGADITIDVKSAYQRIHGGEQPGYRFATASGVRPVGAAVPLQSADMVHEKLQNLFVNLISERAKEAWGLKT
jgi:uncharacterized protein (TIGR04255 family)